MTACLEVRTKIVLFVEGRSTHSSRREENPFRCPSFSIRDRATRAKRTMLAKRQTPMFSQHEESKTSHCKRRSRGVLEPTCQVGRALGVGTGTLPRLVFCCKVFQVFSAEPPSSGKATSQNVVSMCAHTSDTHLWFPRAPTLQVSVSVPPERAWRKVCFKSAFCPRKLTFIRLIGKTQDGVSLNYHVY